MSMFMRQKSRKEAELSPLKLR